MNITNFFDSKIESWIAMPVVLFITFIVSDALLAFFVFLLMLFFKIYIWYKIEDYKHCFVSDVNKSIRDAYEKLEPTIIANKLIGVKGPIIIREFYVLRRDIIIFPFFYYKITHYDLWNKIQAYYAQDNEFYFNVSLMAESVHVVVSKDVG